MKGWSERRLHAGEVDPRLRRLDTGAAVLVLTGEVVDVPGPEAGGVGGLERGVLRHDLAEGATQLRQVVPGGGVSFTLR